MRRQYKRQQGKSTIKKKKKTELKFDGIEFKSGLEVYCYKELKKAGLAFEYEGKTFSLTKDDKLPFDVYKRTQKTPIHKVKSKISRGTKYTPDFLVYDGKDIVFVIETKGYANESFPIRVKLWYSYCINSIKTLKAYFLPSNQKEVDFTISKILEYPFKKRP